MAILSSPNGPKARCPLSRLPAPHAFAGAVPDHSLGVPLGVGEWSGTAEADPEGGLRRAGGQRPPSGLHSERTLRTGGVGGLCGQCFRPSGPGISDALRMWRPAGRWRTGPGRSARSCRGAAGGAAGEVGSLSPPAVGPDTRRWWPGYLRPSAEVVQGDRSGVRGGSGRLWP